MLVGRTIQSRYLILGRLGSGGMGTVYRATDKTLQRAVAIKVLHPEKTAKEEVVLRFYREARKASQLTHPNIIVTHDFGKTEDGLLFIVMELVRGFSMKQILRAEGPIAPGRLIFIMRQVCDGLAEAHTRSIIHRDVKPDNILISKQGNRADMAKILDFGLAKSIQSETEAITRHGSPGTPNYMAPEQISRHVADARSDIYSLGAVMYTLLTGTPVFPKVQDVFAVLWAHVNQEVERPSIRNKGAGIPDDLEQIVLKALAKNPEDRFQSAGEVGEALAECEATSMWSNNDSVKVWARYQLADESEDATSTIQTNDEQLSELMSVNKKAAQTEDLSHVTPGSFLTNITGPDRLKLLLGALLILVVVAGLAATSTLLILGPSRPERNPEQHQPSISPVVVPGRDDQAVKKPVRPSPDSRPAVSVTTRNDLEPSKGNGELREKGEDKGSSGETAVGERREAAPETRKKSGPKRPAKRRQPVRPAVQPQTKTKEPTRTGATKIEKSPPDTHKPPKLEIPVLDD